MIGEILISDAVFVWFDAVGEVNGEARFAAVDDEDNLAFPWREAAVIGSVTLLASVVYYVAPLNIATVLVDRGAGSAR